MGGYVVGCRCFLHGNQGTRALSAWRWPGSLRIREGCDKWAVISSPWLFGNKPSQGSLWTKKYWNATRVLNGIDHCSNGPMKLQERYLLLPTRYVVRKTSMVLQCGWKGDKEIRVIATSIESWEFLRRNIPHQMPSNSSKPVRACRPRWWSVWVPGFGCTRHRFFCWRFLSYRQTS